MDKERKNDFKVFDFVCWATNPIDVNKLIEILQNFKSKYPEADRIMIEETTSDEMGDTMNISIVRMKSLEEERIERENERRQEYLRLKALLEEFKEE